MSNMAQGRDLSDPRTAEVEKKRLKDRSFVNIDRDNFDEVMKGVEPPAGPDPCRTQRKKGSKGVGEIRNIAIRRFSPSPILLPLCPPRPLWLISSLRSWYPGLAET